MNHLKKSAGLIGLVRLQMANEMKSGLAQPLPSPVSLLRTPAHSSRRSAECRSYKLPPSPKQRISWKRPLTLCWQPIGRSDGPPIGYAPLQQPAGSRNSCLSMANPYSKASGTSTGKPCASEILRAVQDFLATCRMPAVLRAWGRIDAARFGQLHARTPRRAAMGRSLWRAAKPVPPHSDPRPAWARRSRLHRTTLRRQNRFTGVSGP